MANFTTEQLAEAKALLDGGKLLFQMVSELAWLEAGDVRDLRQELSAEYGQETIMGLLRTARQNNTNLPDFGMLANRIKTMSLTDAARIDTMIINLQAAIDELNTIKAAL